jgi:hypothetical protein
MPNLCRMHTYECRIVIIIFTFICLFICLRVFVTLPIVYNTVYSFMPIRVLMLCYVCVSI